MIIPIFYFSIISAATYKPMTAFPAEELPEKHTRLICSPVSCRCPAMLFADCHRFLEGFFINQRLNGTGEIYISVIIITDICLIFENVHDCAVLEWLAVAATVSAGIQIV